MLYILCERASNGARDLAAALRGMNVETRKVRRLPELRRNDSVICWGSSAPGLRGNPRVLNATGVANKFRELQKLMDEGVSVPAVSDGRPTTGRWLARTLHHQAANDLLRGLQRGDYYTRFVPTTNEFRFHIVNGESIRCAAKVAGPAAHQEFRTHSAGWTLLGGEHVRGAPGRVAAREAAKQAVAALGYNFGAVDVGVKPDRTAVVFEVNRAPGIEGTTLEAYARAFADWHRGA